MTSDLLRMAESSTQGMLVAPSTKTPSLLFPTPTKTESGIYGLTEHVLLCGVSSVVSLVVNLIWLTLHLDQELCLDTACSLTLVLVSGTAQRVYLINENDGRFVLASQVKQVLHQSDKHKETQRKSEKGIPHWQYRGGETLKVTRF